MQTAFKFEAFETSISFKNNGLRNTKPFKTQLLKWIGNKQRFAHEIISFFPERFGTYFEPFLGSGALLGVLAPRTAEASDCFRPLIEIWQELKCDPDRVKLWYEERWNAVNSGPKVLAYEEIKKSYNNNPNPADLLFLSRSCYGGVVRFRKSDGSMSTPCGIHDPIAPKEFGKRVDLWKLRVSGAEFFYREFQESFERAREGDIVYCDPPYSFSQAILYGAQSFRLDDLFRSIEKSKRRGVFVALSLDGSKKSGQVDCRVSVPAGLFTRDIPVNVGRSMLRRFQMGGQTLEAELVRDRLLLTH